MKSIAYILILALANVFAANSSMADSSMLESEFADSYHYVDHYEVMIDASPQEVWPHILDLRSWMHEFNMLHESGPPGSEGEILRLYEGQDFFLQVVKIIPERMILSVNLPSSIGGEDSVGVSMMTLAEVDGGTLVTNFMSRRYDGAGDAFTGLQERRNSDEYKEFNERMWTDFLLRLKELVEQ